MESRLHQWESDPLFSAAEVVQDSADRMESIFRLLLHELSLVQGDHSDPKLLTSIFYHRRDLATTLETAKWQLEDFERAVNLSTLEDNSQTRKDAIFRHKQFVRAIKEHIIHVEKNVKDISMGDPMRNTEWINVNAHDRDGLALFLSGGSPTEQFDHYNKEDSNILRRFLDPTTASSVKDSSAEIVENKSGEIENLNINGVVHIDHNFDSMKENNLRKVGSHYSTRLGLEALDYLPETSYNRHGEDGSWDLEANESNPKSSFPENNLRGYHSRMNVLGFMNNLWTTWGSRVNRNYTKRLKDGEEHSHSPSQINAYHAVQGQHMGMRLAPGCSRFQGLWSRYTTKVMHLGGRLGAYSRAIYQKSLYHFQVNRHSIKLISAILLALMVLGVLVSRIA